MHAPPDQEDRLAREFITAQYFSLGPNIVHDWSEIFERPLKCTLAASLVMLPS